MEVEMEMDEVGQRAASSQGSASGSGGGSGHSADASEEEEQWSLREAGTCSRAELFDCIMQECRHNSPGQCFSARVREEIERLTMRARVRLVSRTRAGCAPLFVACARGNLPAAHYLLQVCGASLEQRGLYRLPGEAAPHRVTALWAAAVTARLDMLRALADAGADLDAGSDSGSSPLRSACFLSHDHVVRFLLRRGANPAGANHAGGTCLVNAVQSPSIVRLLLDSGAPVDTRDSQHKTALHYAVQEQHEESARLLLAAGADPLLRSRDGDDALQLACIKGATRLVMALVATLPDLGTARVADAYELLGATQLDEYNDVEAALHSWRVATALRTRNPQQLVPKRPVQAPVRALGGAREWTTMEELAAHAHDADWVRSQALLVVLRVLGPHHNDTLFRLMYRGAAYADAGWFARCLHLWLWVLELRIQRDTGLHAETNQTLVALTRLLLEGDAAGEGRVGGEAPRVAMQLLRQLADELPEWQRLVSIRPACRVQCNMFDRTLRCVLHLIFVAHVSTVPQPGVPVDYQQLNEFEAELHEQVSRLVSLDLALCATGDSLLHLACSRLTVVRSTYFADDMPQLEEVFPSACVSRLLVVCGADVSRRNRARCTPLHLAAIPYNFSTHLVETLLLCGAHLDQPNRFGDSPAELVQLNPQSRVRPLQHLSLACLAARAVLRREARAHFHSASRRLPATLRPFLRLHQP